MVQVHGRRVASQAAAVRDGAAEQPVAVAVDAGKFDALVLVADFTGERLCPPLRVRDEP